MKAIIIMLSIISFTIMNIAAQINPLGVYLDIDGKIKFWESEPNRNGNVDDTVYVTFDGKTVMEDLRNLRYDDLTLLEAPRARWTSPCNMDPSRVNDTSYTNTSYDNSTSNLISFNNNIFYYTVDSIALPVKTLTPPKKKHFSDDIRGDGLNDSVVNIVKDILGEYINHYYGKFIPDDARTNLRTKLSCLDTVIEKIAIYDYLVDLIVSYDYDVNDNLTRVLGYHWDYGVEVDSLKYDKSGNIIYYSREKLGFAREELVFEYDDSLRVSTVIYYYRSTLGDFVETYFSKPDIHKMKFTYDKTGKINSKSNIQKDGTWLTCYYEIKKDLVTQ